MKKWLSIFLAVTLTAMLAVSFAEAPAFEQTIDWDAEYDVVVIGYGAAGSAAAITACDAGASVLLLEKAPKGEEGGNSRVCAQGFSCAKEENREILTTYMHSLRGSYSTPSDEILDTYVQGMIETPAWVENTLGTTDYVVSSHQEYPEFEGGGYEKIQIGGGSRDGKMYALMQENVEKRDIDVWYESPAEHLVQDPVTKIVHGVIAKIDGKDIYIRATNGVVLACGGFESNQTMIENYLGKPGIVALGGIKYNDGDGIRMGIEVGANLWHMGNAVLPDYDFHDPETGFTSFTHQVTGIFKGAIMVGPDGTRFQDESFKPRHGKIYFHGSFIDVPFPDKIYAIYDEEIVNNNTLVNGFSEHNVEEIAKGWITKCDTTEDLAAFIGCDPAEIAKTIERYNYYCEIGEDWQFGRKAEQLISLEAPYYIYRVYPTVVNTQGGPERNEKAEVISTTGTPIPHLYEAGELGDIWSWCYNAYSNIGGGFVFGRIAGANAAAAKDDVIQDSLLTKEAFTNVIAEKTYEKADNQYIGHGRGKAEMTVRVTVDDGKITNVEILEQSESEGLSDSARERIPAAIVEQNTWEVDGISGATLTSNGIREAVADALQGVELK